MITRMRFLQAFAIIMFTYILFALKGVPLNILVYSCHTFLLMNLLKLPLLFTFSPFQFDLHFSALFHPYFNTFRYHSEAYSGHCQIFMMELFCKNSERFLAFTQPAFTCSKLAIETLEQGVKYIQS